MYQIQMQFIPGNSTIWVSQLTPEDPIYNFATENEAWTNAVAMQNADPTGRLYRAIYIEQ